MSSESASKEGKILIVLSVSPADEDTDIKEVESKVRGISKPGLIWRDSKTEPVFGKLERLKIIAIIDISVSIDEIEQEISDMEDLVQSVTCDSMSLI